MTAQHGPACGLAFTKQRSHSDEHFYRCFCLLFGKVASWCRTADVRIAFLGSGAAVGRGLGFGATGLGSFRTLTSFVHLRSRTTLRVAWSLLFVIFRNQNVPKDWSSSQYQKKCDERSSCQWDKRSSPRFESNHLFSLLF